MTARLRVALVVPYFPLERHETGYPHVMETIERVTADCDVTVISLRDRTPHAPYRMAGADVRRLGLGTLRGPQGRARVLAAGVREVLRAHRRAPLNLVHGWWVDEPGAVATVAARVLRRPSIASVLGGELVAFPDLGYGAALGRGGRWTARLALRLADEVTVGSNELRALVDRYRPGAVALPLGVDVRRFRPAADRSQPDFQRRVLFVASLEPVKQPALALRTFARLIQTRPDVLLDVIGDGTLRSELEALSESLGIRDRVNFRGHVAHPEMPDAYRGASLLLVTSRFESQLVVAHEAGACGVPVVGPRVGVLPELGEAALIADEASEEALAGAAARVLDEPDLAARMAATGRAVTTERYDLTRTVADLLDLYRRSANLTRA